MAFSFYLRNEGDFRQFYWLMKRGKEKFGKNWPFSLMDMHVMDEYFRQYKNNEKNLNHTWKPSSNLSKEQKSTLIGPIHNPTVEPK